MDINFIQETIDSLRTLTQLNGALTRLNSLLINEVAKESSLNSAKEEILTAVGKGGGGGGSELLEDFFGVVPDDSEEIITDEEITQELEDIFNTIFN